MLAKRYQGPPGGVLPSTYKDLSEAEGSLQNVLNTLKMYANASHLDSCR